MEKYVILYYSKTGNSKFLAEKLSEELGCISKRIQPIINSLPILFLISFMKISLPINISKKEIENYSDVIIIGPIWGGLLIAPLRSVIKKCIQTSKHIHFAVTCETKDEEKENKYGYAQVMKEVGDLGGKLVLNTEAFPTALANTENKAWSPKLSEKIKIREANFNEALKQRLSNFAKKITTF